MRGCNHPQRTRGVGQWTRGLDIRADIWPSTGSNSSRRRVISYSSLLSSQSLLFDPVCCCLRPRCARTGLGRLLHFASAASRSHNVPAFNLICSECPIHNSGLTGATSPRTIQHRQCSSNLPSMTDTRPPAPRNSSIRSGVQVWWQGMIVKAAGANGYELMGRGLPAGMRCPRHVA